MYRLAQSLAVLRSQVNEKYPDRSKVSDGWIGDTSHSSRVSDHNPNPAGVVQAMDITHDPAHGFDSYEFAEYLRLRRDRRIKYIISNRRICSSITKPWVWRPYTGINPHNHHVHISVKDQASYYDDANIWDVGMSSTTVLEVPKISLPTFIHQGDRGEDVRKLQSLLKVPTDGIFGSVTKNAVMDFQKAHGLVVDGIVGAHTWTILLTLKSGALNVAH